MGRPQTHNWWDVGGVKRRCQVQIEGNKISPYYHNVSDASASTSWKPNFNPKSQKQDAPLLMYCLSHFRRSTDLQVIPALKALRYTNMELVDHHLLFLNLHIYNKKCYQILSKFMHGENLFNENCVQFDVLGVLHYYLLLCRSTLIELKIELNGGAHHHSPTPHGVESSRFPHSQGATGQPLYFQFFIF